MALEHGLELVGVGWSWLELAGWLVGWLELVGWLIEEIPLGV